MAVILPALQSAARRVAGVTPNIFFGSNNTLEGELCDLINEVARDVLASHDWQGLTKIHTITADGVAETFPKPDDYERMILVSDIQNTQSWFWGYYHAESINEFITLQDSGWVAFPGAWLLMQDVFTFTPAPTGEAKFPYVSKNYAVDAATLASKPEFNNDTDSFVLPLRLLTLGLVWRWREQKKLDFTGDQESYLKALSEECAKDKGSRVIRRSGRRYIRGTYPGWPWPLG